MKQCRTDCIHAEACRRFADNSTYWNSGDCPIYKPTADVAPKREIALEIINKIQRPLTMYKRPLFSYDLILQEVIKAIGAVIEEYTEEKTNENISD